jgi:hypothetical protein
MPVGKAWASTPWASSEFEDGMLVVRPRERDLQVRVPATVRVLPDTVHYIPLDIINYDDVAACTVTIKADTHDPNAVDILSSPKPTTLVYTISPGERVCLLLWVRAHRRQSQLPFSVDLMLAINLAWLAPSSASSVPSHEALASTMNLDFAVVALDVREPFIPQLTPFYYWHPESHSIRRSFKVAYSDVLTDVCIVYESFADDDCNIDYSFQGRPLSLRLSLPLTGSGALVAMLRPQQAFVHWFRPCHFDLLLSSQLGKEDDTIVHVEVLMDSPSTSDWFYIGPRVRRLALKANQTQVVSLMYVPKRTGPRVPMLLPVVRLLVPPNPSLSSSLIQWHALDGRRLDDPQRDVTVEVRHDPALPPLYEDETER